MSRATLLSRVVFGLLVIATFTAFFAAQRLKRTDPLVYAVQLKKYVSPNSDGLRDRARLRFRTKKADVVTVDVVNRAQRVVRTIAHRRPLSAGPHRFLWNGRDAGGRPVPDGAYRVRISMRASGRTFVPDKFFVVDTRPPPLAVDLVGRHSVPAGRLRPGGAMFRFSGVSSRRRVEFLVFRADRGDTAELRPVAAFASDRGKATGRWDFKTGAYRRRATPCFGRLRSFGRARPAQPGRYVVVARACDAAGNVGLSSGALPPSRGTTRGRSGITLRGIELAPATRPLRPGQRATLLVSAPSGRYRWRLHQVGEGEVATGRARGPAMHIRIPSDASAGLYEVSIRSRRAAPGENLTAMAPLVVTGRGRTSLLVVYPAIAWQAGNAVDADGDGFSDAFDELPDGREQRIRADGTLIGGRPPAGYAARESAFARFVAAQSITARATTDLALAVRPAALLRGVKGVIFAGDARYAPPQLGLALRRYVEHGGRVAFFGPDAFRRTVRVSGASISGPSARADRDVFGESIQNVRVAPAPVVPFADALGLLRGPAGLFNEFEQSRSRAADAEILTSAGRQQGRPAVIAYGLGNGLVIRVGAAGWQSRLVPGRADAGVVFTTRRIFEVLTR